MQTFKIILKLKVLVISLSIDGIAKLLNLFCEIVDCKYVLISFSSEKFSPDATNTGIVKQILKATKTLGNAVTHLFTAVPGIQTKLN